MNMINVRNLGKGIFHWNENFQFRNKLEKTTNFFKIICQLCVFESISGDSQHKRILTRPLTFILLTDGAYKYL